MSNQLHGSGEYVRGTRGPILVADDDLLFTELLTTVLAAEGYGVVARHSAEGLRAYLTASFGGAAHSPLPALVVLDICMPVEDGLEALRKLQEGAWGIPAIVVTGRARAGDERGAIDSGAVAFFEKPISTERLLASVRRHARRAKWTREPRRSTTRVLVADDDEDLRSLISTVLEEDGHEVLQAADGPETLTSLAASLEAGGQRIDVMLLDIRMPGYSGLGVLSAMRNLPAASKPVTIVMTSMTEPSYAMLSRGYGALGVLQKPFEVNDLRTVVANAARLRDPARQVTSALGGTR